MLLLVVGVAVGDGLRKARADRAAPVATQSKPARAPIVVCRGDVDGVVTAHGTVGVDTSSADGGDTVKGTASTVATVVVLGEFPAGSTPEPYVGQRAWASLSSDDTDYEGRVSGAQYDDGGSILYVAVTLDHAPVGATDGDPATVALEVGVSEDTLYVPTSLLHRRGTTSWVDVRRAGVTLEVSVRVGLSGRGRSEIMSGLRPDDELVVAPGSKVSCGAVSGAGPSQPTYDSEAA